MWLPPISTFRFSHLCRRRPRRSVLALPRGQLPVRLGPFCVAEPLSSIRYFWTTIDPIGNMALFAGLTAALSRSERHLTALRAVIYATIILVAAGTVGQVS